MVSSVIFLLRFTIRIGKNEGVFNFINVRGAFFAMLNRSKKI